LACIWAINSNWAKLGSRVHLLTIGNIFQQLPPNSSYSRWYLVKEIIIVKIKFLKSCLSVVLSPRHFLVNGCQAISPPASHLEVRTQTSQSISQIFKCLELCAVKRLDFQLPCGFHLRAVNSVLCFDSQFSCVFCVSRCLFSTSLQFLVFVCAFR
jgi:hypothetical protein